MPNLTPVSSFDSVPELETTTLALGGPGGPLNQPSQALLNRTQWLHDNAAAGSAGPYAVAAGTANAITAAYTPTITAVADGMKLRFNASSVNTGAVTFAPNSVAAAPVLGGALQALQGGEIGTNGYVEVTWSVTASAWILTAQAGGSVQVPDATQSKQAASKGQVDALAASVAATYESQASAAATYESQTSAASTYTAQTDLASTATGKGSALVGDKSPATGSVDRTQYDRNRERISVFDFIPESEHAAILAGTSTLDVSPYIQLACNTGAGTVYGPYGKYTFNGTVTPTADQVLEFQSNGFGGGAKIIAVSGFNGALFKFTNSGRIKNVSLLGSATSLLTTQRLVWVNNTNGVTLENVFLQGGYDALYVDGTSFYVTLKNVVFYDNINTQLTVNSATSAGVDMLWNNVRFLNHSGPYCAKLTGLGSLLATNFQFTTNTCAAATFLLDTPATNFGGAQLTNGVVENSGAGPSLYVKGTGTAKWYPIKLTNVGVTGSTGPGLRIDYATSFGATDCSISSSSTQGSLYFPASGNINDFTFTDCSFTNGATTTPIQCGGPISLSGNFIAPSWGGSAPMIDFTAASSGNVGYLNVIGGGWGTNGTPIALTNAANIAGTILGNVGWNAYTPTVAATTGTLTTANATGLYQRLGKIIHFQIAATITTNGTGAGAINLSLPNNAAGVFISVGKGTAISGKSLQGASTASSNLLRVGNYDGTYPAADGEVLVLTGTYEAD